MARELSLDNSLILTGPTGSGKSALALELAPRLGAEIIAMDSMTLYRGMDIGTAKPTPTEQSQARHHFLSVLEPWESASVAWWLGEAERCVCDIESRGLRPLFVGGTPLYLKALLYGLFDGPPADPEIRQRLLREAELTGSERLHERLARLDPQTALRLHPNDERRIIRALEVWELTGRSISSWQTQWKQPRPRFSGPPRCLWLDLPRNALYARIDARVRQMFANGLVEEAQALRKLPRPISKEARQAVGYKEVFDYLDGKLSLEDTVELIQAHSRQFAKRQLTWFRHLPDCQPVTRELTFTAWGLTMEG
jgi:tRNA dimethylallyltransferase